MSDDPIRTATGRLNLSEEELASLKSVMDRHKAMCTDVPNLVLGPREAITQESAPDNQTVALGNRLEWVVSAPTAREFLVRKGSLTRHDIRRLMSMIRGE